MFKRFSYVLREAARSLDCACIQSQAWLHPRNLRRGFQASAHNGNRIRRYDRTSFGEGKQTASDASVASGTNLYSVAAGVVGVGAAVYWTNQETVPITKRSHLVLFPKSWEPLIGKSAVSQSIPEGARVLPADHPRTKSVQFIVDSLAKNVASLEGLPAHMRDVNWTVTVVEHKMVNAMAAPGGQVIVFTGIMDLLSDRNELAAVIAHEMAHVLARHSAEAITGQILFLPLSMALALMLDTSTTIFGHLHRLMVGLPGSRANEREADLIGMHLAARACFAPQGMVNMLQKLERVEKRSGAKAQPALLRTHPLTSDRVAECRNRVSEVRQVLEASGCDPFLSQFSVPNMVSEAFTPYHHTESL